MLPTDSDIAERLTPFGKWLHARIISVGVIVILISGVLIFLAFESEDIRKWLGALSGWIAAIGALGVGIPTVIAVRNQAKLPWIQKKLEENYIKTKYNMKFRRWLFAQRELKTKLSEHSYEGLNEYVRSIEQTLDEITTDFSSHVAIEVQSRFDLQGRKATAIKRHTKADGIAIPTDLDVRTLSVERYESIVGEILKRTRQDCKRFSRALHDERHRLKQAETRIVKP